MLQSTPASLAQTLWCWETSAAFFCSPVAAPPRVFLEWHHTAPAVLACTHLPVITHTSDLSCSRTSWHGHIMRRVRPNWPALEKNTLYKSEEVCNTYGQLAFVFIPLFLVPLCLFSFNTLGPNSELVCKSLYVYLCSNMWLCRCFSSSKNSW